MLGLIGYTSEATFAHFLAAVTASGRKYVVLDLAGVRSSLACTINRANKTFRVQIDDALIDLSEAKGVYARAYYVGSPVASKNHLLSTLIQHVGAWLQCSDAVVVNRPSAASENANKLVQLRNLANYGFCVPETLVTGDEGVARAKLSADGTWISKSISSCKTRAVVVDHQLFNRLHLLKTSPSLFQRRIEGADVRVHVVGSELFAEEIVSSAVDYRFADAASRSKFRPIACPPGIVQACLNYCFDQRLDFGGFDFKVDSAGVWYALECNPMPGYEAYDRRSGGKISAALIEHLSSLTVASPATSRESVDVGEPFICPARRPLMKPV